MRLNQLSANAKFVLAAVIVALFGAGGITLRLRHNTEQSKTRFDGKAAEPATEAEIAARSKIAPFRVLSVDGVKSTDFTEVRGKATILSFWASWCGPCLFEMPTFVEVERRFHDRGLRIVAVNVDEDPAGRALASEFWKTHGFVFSTFFDLDRKLQTQFSVDSLPTNFVLDREGRVAFSGFGANDWSSPQTIELIEQLIAE